MRAKNFCCESVTCLWSSPFTCMKRLASCFGAFPYDSCFEICLQKGSVFCICRSPSNLSADKDFGVVFPISVMTGAAASDCGVGSLDECCWAVWLLVWNLGPSEYVTDSKLIVVGLFWGNSTRGDKQSAALLHAPYIHLEVILCVASSSPHLLTLLFAFFAFKNFASSLWSFLTIM